MQFLKTDRPGRPKAGSRPGDAGYQAPENEGRILRKRPLQQKDSGLNSPLRPGTQAAFLFLFGCALASVFIPSALSQAAASSNQIPQIENLPDAPAPQNLAPLPPPSQQPCSANEPGQWTSAADQSQSSSTSRVTGVSTSLGTTATARPAPCKHYSPLINWYVQVVKGPPLKQNGTEVEPLTVDEKGWLAAHNLLDPFNLITIAGEAGISVAANSHSGYGPGFPGLGATSASASRRT